MVQFADIKVDDSVFQKRVKFISKSTDKVTSRTVEIIAELFLRELQKRLPVETGQYRDSWKMQRTARNTLVVFTPLQDLAAWLEFGTSPHTIRGNPVLRFKDPNSGETVFAAMVNHPGTEPIPHIRPAALAVKRKAKKVIRKRYRGLSKGRV